MNQSLIRLTSTLIAVLLHGTAMGALIVTGTTDNSPAQMTSTSVIDVAVSLAGDAVASQEEAAPQATDMAQSAAAEESHLGATAAQQQDESQQKAPPPVADNTPKLDEAIQQVDSEKLASQSEAPPQQTPAQNTERVEKADQAVKREKSEISSVEGADVQRNAQAASAGGIGSQQNGEGKAKASGGSTSSAPYARIVAAELARHKHYPSQARDQNVTGTVSLHFTIGEAGTIIAKAILQSSGHAVLDEAAQVMLATARFPPPPGGRFTASVPVRFERR